MLLQYSCFQKMTRFYSGVSSVNNEFVLSDRPLFPWTFLARVALWNIRRAEQSRRTSELGGSRSIMQLLGGLRHETLILCSRIPTSLSENQMFAPRWMVLSRQRRPRPNDGAAPVACCRVGVDVSKNSPATSTSDSYLVPARLLQRQSSNLGVIVTKG